LARATRLEVAEAPSQEGAAEAAVEGAVA
jgi:hypothetical protein